MTIQFFVEGIPAPGGSKNGFPFKRADGSLGVRMVDAGKGNAAWKKVVGYVAKSHMNRLHLQPFDGPLKFSATFVMPRGKTVRRQLHTIAPDLSKLIRSTEDAMTDIVWVDDAQIIEHGRMMKRYAVEGEGVGAYITVEAVAQQQEIVFKTQIKPAPIKSAAPTPELEPSPFD